MKKIKALLIVIIVLILSCNLVFAAEPTYSRLSDVTSWVKGFLGIGTDNPKSSLEINGNFSVGNSSNNNELIKINGERSWFLGMNGTGSDTYMLMKPEFNGKTFKITSFDESRDVISIQSSDTSNNLININSNSDYNYWNINDVGFLGIIRNASELNDQTTSMSLYSVGDADDGTGARSRAAINLWSDTNTSDARNRMISIQSHRNISAGGQRSEVTFYSDITSTGYSDFGSKAFDWGIGPSGSDGIFRFIDLNKIKFPESYLGYYENETNTNAEIRSDDGTFIINLDYNSNDANENFIINRDGGGTLLFSLDNEGKMQLEDGLGASGKPKIVFNDRAELMYNGSQSSIDLYGLSGKTTRIGSNGIPNYLTVLTNGDINIQNDLDIDTDLNVDGTTTLNGVTNINNNGDTLNLGDGSNSDVYTELNVRGYLGYKSSNGRTIVQGKSGKGIDFNVNNDLFGSGTALTIYSSGQADHLGNEVINIEELEVNGISGDGTGQAVCIKANGFLGTCSDAVNSTGGCTCS